MQWGLMLCDIGDDDGGNVIMGMVRMILVVMVIGDGYVMWFWRWRMVMVM